jgi:alkanesulfonate monooxygenase SsuD/methylene tetrahydromethanopterin reductase-like flavin-dependent oxidoreductase (luciferase family)
MLLAGNPNQVAEQLAVWRELGVDQIVTRTMGLSDDDDLTTVELLGEVQALLA